MLVIGLAVLAAGCGEGDPGALGPSGVDGGLSPEGQRQDYVDGVTRALAQLGAATQTPAFSRAVETGNKRQLQTATLAWRQGGEQLKTLNPPKDAVPGHTSLVKAVEALDGWNQRILKVAPNKAMTRKIGGQASDSPASKQFEDAICELVDAGYDVVDPAVCGTPLDGAEPPVG